MTTGLCLCPTYDWLEKDQEQVCRLIEGFKRVRLFFYGDYYPLTAHNTRDDVWIGYQFHREDMKARMFLAFRRQESPYLSARLKLRGILPSARYELTYEDTGIKQVLTGETICAGIDVTIDDAPGSLLVTYNPHISQYSSSNGGVIALGNEMPAVFTNFIGFGASGISNNDGSSQNLTKEETTQETRVSSEKSESNDRIENIPAKFTNRKELASSRKPGEDCYGISFYTIYVSIPINYDIKQLTKEGPWQRIMEDFQKPNKKITPLAIGELVAKEYPQMEIKILYNEGLNLTRRVKAGQVFLPSVVAYMNEQNKPQYMTFLADEYDTWLQIDSVCADDINEIWDSNWGRPLLIPDRTVFLIDAKFQDDLNKKIMSKELREKLRKELVEYKVQLSPTAEITYDGTEWRIDQDDFWFTIQKQDKDYLNFVVRLKGNAEGKWKWKRHGGYGGLIPDSSGSDSSGSLFEAGWGVENGKSFGSFNFLQTTKANPDYITLYPGEVLDITKPPLISIDSKYAIKPAEKEKTEK